MAILILLKHTIVYIVQNNYSTLNSNCQIFIIIIGDFIMNNYSVGKRIREIRIRKHLSQEQIALRAEITTAYLGQIERGEKNPTVKSVEQISNALGISLSELFSNQGAPIANVDGTMENIIFEMQDLSIKERKEMLDIIRNIIKFKKE